MDHGYRNARSMSCVGGTPIIFLAWYWTFGGFLPVNPSKRKRLSTNDWGVCCKIVHKPGRGAVGLSVLIIGLSVVYRFIGVWGGTSSGSAQASRYGDGFD